MTGFLRFVPSNQLKKIILKFYSLEQLFLKKPFFFFVQLMDPAVVVLAFSISNMDHIYLIKIIVLPTEVATKQRLTVWLNGLEYHVYNR